MARTKAVVCTFGRFNPPSIGHRRLFETMVREAANFRITRGRRPLEVVKEDEDGKPKRELIPQPDRSSVVPALPLVFSSVKQDAESNPLPYREKLIWLRRFFPGVTFVENKKVRTLFDMLKALETTGATDVKLVCGSDHAAEFAKLKQYVRDTGPKGGRFLIFQSFEVVPVPEMREAASPGVSGASGTKQRKAARAGNFAAFREGTPTANPLHARKLFYRVRKHMGLTKGHAYLICGLSRPDIQTLREKVARIIPRVIAFGPETDALMEQGKPFFVDVSGHSVDTIRGLLGTLTEAHYTPRLLVQDVPMPRYLGEAWVRQRAVVGMLRKLPETVFVNSAADAVTLVTRQLKEAEEGGKEHTGDKQPTDVDRLKTRQQQELLAVKQRQSNDLLQAKTRDLQKKTREQSIKLSQHEKPESE